ncbi:restriction endonuclease subunit S [Fusobacterium mortiferum]|uniref:restriction endonuclease subunit S n=1 Tax=Fusobacterium mortiferum TaxID=850 RepID=UPI00158BA487|nr:restriction endonuclease subunit S [Fusobacterium mortiferum]
MSKKKENLSLEEKLQKVIIPKEEEPYIIPDNWIWIRLGETGNYKKGPFGSSLTKSIFVAKGENTVKVYEQKNAIKKDWKLGDYYITREYYEKNMKSFSVKSGDIIVSCAGTIGETYILPDNIEEGIINQALMRITLNSLVKKEYYIKYFDFMLKKLSNSFSKGTAIKNIPPFKIFKELPFPLIPLEEQKRIVEKLDSLYEKTQKIKEIIEEVKEKTISRREAILSKAFTGELTEKWRSENKTSSAEELLYKINDEKIKEWQKEYKKAEEEGKKKPSKPQIKDISEMLVKEDEIPYKVPDNWVWTSIGNVIFLLSGQDISSKLCNSNKIGIPYILGASNIINNIFYAERWIENPKVVSLKNDLLLSVKGTIGKLYLQKEKKINISRQIMALRPYNSCLEVKYLKYFLEYTMESLKSEGNGLIPGIPRDIVLNKKIVLPPLEEQKEIVRILDKVFEEENKIDKLLEIEKSIEVLESSILNKAFKGELGTQNKDDYPILERLKEIL